MDALGMDWISDENAASEAEPVKPFVREAAAALAQESQRRKPVEPKAEPETPAEPAAEQPVASVRGGYGYAAVNYQILEEAMRGLTKQERAGRNKAIRVWVDALAKEVGGELTGVNNRLVLRFREAERRIAELEARIAKLEGRNDG